MSPPRLPRTVVVLGLVSLLNDLASEMIVPLIPILLATVLAAGPIALGAIEGVAEAIASFLKLWSGRRSDLLGGRRKGFALGGYLLSNLARPLIGLAASWLVVLILRSIDRVGKGLRSAPRDALVADVTAPHMKGYAYGFHRALDNGGAVAGGLIAAAVLAWAQLPLSQVILLSAVPGLLAVALIGFGIHEPARATVPPPLPPLRWGALQPALKRYLAALAVFAFARVSETFIVLRGHELGAGTVELLLLWSALNLAKAATSTTGGRWSDRLHRAVVLLIGWSAFALAFSMFALVETMQGLWIVTLFYGLSFGLGEGAERAAISEYADASAQGTAFGWYHLVLGLTAIPAGLLFGVLWAWQSAAFAFFLAGGLAAAAALLLRLWAWPNVAERSQREPSNRS
jgi:MFS family permease